MLAAPPLAIFVFAHGQGLPFTFATCWPCSPSCLSGRQNLPPSSYCRAAGPRWQRPPAWPGLSASCGSSTQPLRFHELAGGPGRGHLHLVDSGIAWGQDLLLLRSGTTSIPTWPFFVAAMDSSIRRWPGPSLEIPPLLPDAHGDVADFPWRPGSYAIDVNYLQGSQKAMPSGKNGYTVPPPGGLRYFEGLRPSDRVGYSFRIFHFSETDVHRLRRQVRCLAPD